MGDQYAYIAMDATRKAILSYRVGKRTIETTRDFVADLHSRVLNRPQITSDGFGPYLTAMWESYGTDVDYAMLVKHYQGTQGPETQHRYSPGRIRGLSRQPLIGKPREGNISTSLIERQNLTLRMHIRRFTRLTNAFSKKLRNHRAA